MVLTVFCIPTLGQTTSTDKPVITPESNFSSNSKPIISSLTRDTINSRDYSKINWTARAIDPDGDQILYKFLVNDVPVTDWTTNNSWISDSYDIGSDWIEVQVRDGKHADPSGMDDSMGAQ